ncbi:hypothetical protein Q4I28_004020 [Leishmania naiffi]|uniref:Uncharacterized protein n=1 Tax=Leishmania naiffi TaxID=5678 RepID=A0AAW3BS45_9TRYP
MKMHPRAGWSCAVQPPQSSLLQLLALVLMCLCTHITFVKAAVVDTNVWLSAPVQVWQTIASTPEGQYAIKAAAEIDFTTAVKSLDNSASVTVKALTPYVSPSSGPAYGADISFSVTSDSLSDSQVLSAVRSSTLPNINSFLANNVGLAVLVKALGADGPSAMVSVGQMLLPVTGSTFFWQVLLDRVATEGFSALSLFMMPLQIDVQAAVDVAVQSYFVEMTPATNQVNASSLYVSYIVWAFPGAEVSPGTSSGLEELVRKSTLPEFNSYMSTLKDTYPDLQAYSDLFPTEVRFWTPPSGNPFDPDSTNPNADLPALVNDTGDYFLLFRGDAETWGQVWEHNRLAVSASIESAIEKRLHRRSFVNHVSVLSAKTVTSDLEHIAGLQVLCRVVQGITRISSHLWSPEEMASLLLQGDYNATQALYYSGGSVPPEGLMQPHAAVVQPIPLATVQDAPGTLATTRLSYDYSVRLSKAVVGIISMAAVIVGISLVVIIIAVGLSFCPQHIGGGTNMK